MVEGDAILTGMRKEASKAVSRLLRKLELELQNPESSGNPSAVSSNHYCVGVCIGYTETAVTLLVNGKVAHTTSDCIGLFVPASAAAGDKRKQKAQTQASLPQNPLIHIMQNVFETLLSFLEGGFIAELPVQIPNASWVEREDPTVASSSASRYPLNTEQVVLSCCSPSPMVSRLLLVRAWNEMCKAMLPTIEHLLGKPKASSLGGFDSPGRFDQGQGQKQGEGEEGDEWGVRSPRARKELPALSGVKVIHSHSTAAALIAGYFSRDCFALFKATPSPFHRLPLDGSGPASQLEANMEVEIDFAADDAEGDNLVGNAGAGGTGTTTVPVRDLSSLEVRCTEGVLHVLVSTEDLVLYISVLLVTTNWSRTGSPSSSAGGGGAYGRSPYKAESSSVRWLHHSRHSFKPLFVAKQDPSTGRTNQFGSKDEVTQFLTSVWELHVLRSLVPADIRTPGGTEPLVDVKSFLQVYPIRGIQFVGKECSIYARRHDKQQIMLCAPRPDEAVVNDQMELYLLLPYERVVEASEDSIGLNNYQNNTCSGVFEPVRDTFYPDAQKQRHAFVRQVEEFFRKRDLHSAEDRTEVHAVSVSVTLGGSAIPADSGIMTEIPSVQPTPNYSLPVLVSFELSGVYNEALGAALFGSSLLVAHSALGQADDRGLSHALNMPPRTLKQLENALSTPKPDGNLPLPIAAPSEVTTDMLPPLPPTLADDTAKSNHTTVLTPVAPAVNVRDVSGYSIGVRSTSRLSSSHPGGNTANVDNLFNLGCGLTGGPGTYPVIPTQFIPFISSSMELPASVTHELEYYNSAAEAAKSAAGSGDSQKIGDTATTNSAGSNKYQLDIMVSSNINKYFCRPCQYARVALVDENRAEGICEDGDSSGPLTLVVTLSLNERREVQISVSRKATAGSGATNVQLLKQQRLAYTPQVAQLEGHLSYWICPTLRAKYKDLGNAEVKIATAKREESCSGALSAKEEEERRQQWVRERHVHLQLALLFYSEGLRCDPCNHLVLSNRCAVLTHLENSGANSLSNRALARANCDHRGRPICHWFVNKATVYLATTYLFSALFDAKECIRHSHFTFSKGFVRLGALYYHLKKFDNALALYRFGLHLDPTNKSITDSIIDTQEKLVNLEGKNPNAEPVNYVKSIKDRFKELHSQKDKKNKARNKEKEQERKQFKVTFAS